jgi:hypothetical protein
MSDHGLGLYDVMALQRRPLDGALGVMDVAFVRKNCPLRAASLLGQPCRTGCAAVTKRASLPGVRVVNV